MAFLSALHALENHGQNPNHYHLQELEIFAGNIGQRDRLATDTWFSAAAHMIYGKLDPVSIEPDWTAAGRRAGLVNKKDAEALAALADSESRPDTTNWPHGGLAAYLENSEHGPFVHVDARGYQARWGF